jgi:hypothetical protein
MVKMSFLNPQNWVKVSPTEIPQYNSKWIDDYFWKLRLNEYQKSAPPYFQLWQNNDVIDLQWENNAGQITIETKTCQGKTVASYIMQQKQQNTFDPSYFIYEAHMAQTLLPPGIYFNVAKVGVSPISDVLISEPFYIQSKHPSTLLIQYKHRHFREGMIFETGIEPSLRIKAYWEMLDPESTDTTFEDQIADMVTLKSVPYRLWKLHIEQIPDWMINILNFIFGCSSVRIDGIAFSKNKEAKIESNTPSFNKALANYTIELREAQAKQGKEFPSTVVSNDEITLMVNAESKGFADTSENASSSIVTFIDIN